MFCHEKPFQAGRRNDTSPPCVVTMLGHIHRTSTLGNATFKALIVLLISTFAINLTDASAYSFRVKVQIDSLRAEDGFGDSNSGADFYTEMTIDGTTINNYGTPGQQALEGNDFIDTSSSVDWAVSEFIDPTEGTVPITIKVFDEDDFLNFGDDHADIKTGSGSDLELTLDLKTCTFTGDLSGSCGVSVQSTGDGEADGDATIHFTVDIVGFNQSGGVHVHCIHDPLWPQPGEEVTITAVALGDNLEPRVVDEIQITQGTSMPVVDETDTPFTSYIAGPFNGTDFTYSCIALSDDDSNGNYDPGEVADSGYRTVAVGAPQGSRAVPVIQTGPESQRQDIVLIPDNGYSGPMDSVFLQDAKNMIDYYYMAGLVLLDNQNKINFWIAQDTGTAGGYVPPDCNLTPPTNWATDYAFSDAAAILHRKDIRDCAKDSVANVHTIKFDENHFPIPFKPTLGFTPFVHELGHAIYGLADEYCNTRPGADPNKPCDGGYYETSSFPNLFKQVGDCESARASDPDGGTKECQSFVSQNPKTSGQTFWTFDPSENDLMVDRKLPNFLDIRRICYVLTGSPTCQ